MTQSCDQSRYAFELHQSGHTLEQIADELDTSDDRTSQLVAAYQKRLPAKPVKPWWYGLSNHSRILMEDLGFHSREDVEAAYQDCAFTEGHPKCLTGLSKRMLKRIEEWLQQPSQ